jgi:hypothetical protein
LEMMTESQALAFGTTDSCWQKFYSMCRRLYWKKELPMISNLRCQKIANRVFDCCLGMLKNAAVSNQIFITGKSCSTLCCTFDKTLV